MKNIFDRIIIQKIITYISYLYIKLVYKTSKIIIKGDIEKIEKIIEKNQKGITFFTWHGRILISPIEIKRLFKNKKQNKYVLASTHKDGQLIGKIISEFGINIINGSSINKKKTNKNTKSLSAIRQIMKILNKKDILIFSPDGPRGPAFKMNTKITNIVQKTSSIIIPVAISYKRKFQLKTWDFFQIPLPFNKIIIDYIEVIEPKKDTNIDELNNKIELNINQHITQNDTFNKF